MMKDKKKEERRGQKKMEREGWENKTSEEGILKEIKGGEREE